VLEIDGKPVLHVLPVTDVAVNHRNLKAAIIARRDESRKSNEEWGAVDRASWDDPDEIEE
jgi:hypothetical protein